MTDIVIRATKAPALALSPITFSQQHFDLYSQQLRVYFNTLDSFTANLSTTAGGSSISFPHISALDTTDQYATASNTPTIVKWDTLDSSLGFTLDPGFYATAQFTGYYKIDYSLQFANTANAPHDVVVWLRVNNVDVAGSASKITITSRKSAGVPSYVLMYSTVPFVVTAGDEIALWWATDLAYNPVGPVAGVYMEYAPAQTVPYPHPSIPSSIGAITFVSRTQI
jgi:hypothetical protein